MGKYKITNDGQGGVTITLGQKITVADAVETIRFEYDSLINVTSRKPSILMGWVTDFETLGIKREATIGDWAYPLEEWDDVESHIRTAIKEPKGCLRLIIAI